MPSILSMESLSRNILSKYDGKRELPNDLQAECGNWFASVPNVIKKSLSKVKAAQPYTLFFARDAVVIFPGRNIDTLTKDELYQLPCDGKFLSKIVGDHSLRAAIGGDSISLSHIKTTSALGHVFIISHWLPVKKVYRLGMK